MKEFHVAARVEWQPSPKHPERRCRRLVLEIGEATFFVRTRDARKIVREITKALLIRRAQSRRGTAET